MGPAWALVSCTALMQDERSRRVLGPDACVPVPVAVSPGPARAKLRPASSTTARMVLCAVAVVAGCTPARPAPPTTETRHPTPENVVALDQLAARIADIEAPPSTRAVTLVQQIRRRHEVLTIGLEIGDPKQVFASIRDVEVDREGNVLVLDSRGNEVRVFARDRPEVASFGGGQRRWQRRTPEGMEILPRGGVAIVDRTNELTEFASTNGGWQVTRRTHLPFVPEDLCANGEDLFVRGWGDDGAVLHVYSVGRHIRSFGSGYRSRVPLVREQLSDGLVECVPSAGVIVTAFTLFPYIYGFSPDGRLLWTSELADFVGMKIVDTLNDRGRPRVVFHSRGDWSRVVELSRLTDGFVLVQVEQVRQVDRAEVRRLKSYLLHAASGTGTYVGDDIPLIRGSRWPNIYGAVERPFPQVMVFEVGRQ